MSAAFRAFVVATLLAPLMVSGCAASGGAIAGSGTTSNTVGVTTYPEGQRPSIPEVVGTTLDGKQLELASLRGHVVVVNAWASWCEPCRDESPALARIATRTAPIGVRFIGLDEEDRAGLARSFARSAGTTYPHLVDSDGKLLRSLRLVPPNGIPSTLVLDVNGRVAVRVVGAIHDETFESLLRSVARGSRASTPTPTG